MLYLLSLLIGCTPEYGFIIHTEPGSGYNAGPVEPDIMEEEFDIIINDTVDILLVIDNSCSMSDSQDILGDNFPVIISELQDSYSDFDYHVGIVSTDTRNPDQSGKLFDLDGSGMLWIDKTTPNAPEIFSEAASLGTWGSPSEAGLEAIWMSAEDYDAKIHNSGFYRENSSFHMLVVTDEDDYSEVCSNGVDSYGYPYDCTSSLFLEWLNDFRVNKTFNVLNDSSNGTYSDVVEYTDGYHGDIEGDWETMAPNLIHQFTIASTNKYYLSQVPKKETIILTVNDSVEFYLSDCEGTCLEYSRQENSITLMYDAYNLQDGDLVVVTYETLESSQ